MIDLDSCDLDSQTVVFGEKLESGTETLGRILQGCEIVFLSLLFFFWVVLTDYFVNSRRVVTDFVLSPPPSSTMSVTSIRF